MGIDDREDQVDREGQPYYIRLPPRLMRSITPCIVGMTLAVNLTVERSLP